jgi:putative CocE/NonD family hydrolase
VASRFLITPRICGFVFAVEIALCLISGLSHAADQYEVIVEHDVASKMRDGVLLRADIYRPKADGQFPVLLQRRYVDKRTIADFGYRGAARGFIVIVQDTRGRFASEGDFYLFRDESNDGYDTVEWAAALPYSNGKVGMFGASYTGVSQMLAAIAHPPHLAGICPVVTGSNYHEGWIYQGGAFEQLFSESWVSGMSQDTLDRFVRKNSSMQSSQWTLPLRDYPLFNFPQLAVDSDLTRMLAPYFLDWLAHPGYDDYWKRWSIQEHFADINVPALHVAAWYDIFQGGSLGNYIGIKLHGGPVARARQRLIVIVGGHAGGGRKVGDIDFGEAADWWDETSIVLDWYDYLFKGIENRFAKEKPVRLFVMGSNTWREEDDWPLARAHTTKYFLHSRGKANSSRGDGMLSTTPPSTESPDRYTYDPANPTPTIGGQLCCDSHLSGGPRDQRPAESRDDVLVYSAPAFARDTEVTGPVSLEFYAASSAVDTDFTAKLVDVGPDGHAENLTDGIVRARYRDSPEAPALMNPGQIYKFTIDLWSTSNVFLKGHVLRLEVSSSNFPRFDRNVNTGEEQATAQRFVSAANIIYHDAGHPSALVLPVIEAQ